MMQLDDVVASTTTGPRVEEAMHRSVQMTVYVYVCVYVCMHILNMVMQV